MKKFRVVISLVFVMFTGVNVLMNNFVNERGVFPDLTKVGFMAIANPEGGGSAFNYDEKATTNKCTNTWNFGVYSTSVEGTYYICVDGNEWFCNSGCYDPGDAPA
ncbi:MAG: hypothetical protein JEZ14_14150 [Marinilabiliaceae bacterium]|nr:hypothetical protein [Marinilabiliaceae bacterium]